MWAKQIGLGLMGRGIATCALASGLEVLAYNRTAKRAEESVAAGREFVNAYVEFVHYVERLHTDAVGAAAHHEVVPAAERTTHEH